MRLRTVLLVGFAFPVLAGAGIPNLFSEFTVEREITLNSGHLDLPGSLSKAVDGGYFVLGGPLQAMVSKTNAEGSLLWTYQEPQIGRLTTRFISSAAAADGGVLLCGDRRELAPVGGFVVLLDKSGQEVSRLDPYAKSEGTHQFIDAVACSRWGDGFMISGGARINEDVSGTSSSHGIPTLMRLDSNGKLLWQKNMWGFFENPQAMSNGDMVFSGVGIKDGIESLLVTRVDGNGDIRATGALSVEEFGRGCRTIYQAELSDHLQFICNANDYRKKEAVVVDLSPDLKIIRKAGFKSPFMGLNRAYRLVDGSMILFGTTTGAIRKFIPTLIEYGPDQIEKARYEFSGSGGLADGMPTGKSGEFVTIRPASNGKNKTGSITFLRHG